MIDLFSEAVQLLEGSRCMIIDYFNDRFFPIRILGMPTIFGLRMRWRHTQIPRFEKIFNGSSVSSSTMTYCSGQ